MTVQIALCDDEPAELMKTEKILRAYEQEHPQADFKIERFESADKLLGMVGEETYLPHLIFIDIYSVCGFLTTYTLRSLLHTLCGTNFYNIFIHY